MRTRLAVLAGRVVSEASPRLGTGHGSATGGRVTFAGPLRLLAAGRRVGLVSGTNGKTTTTRLLAAALTTAGEVSTLGWAPTSCRASWAPSPLPTVGSYAALEIDGGLLPKAVVAVRPAVTVAGKVEVGDPREAVPPHRRVTGVAQAVGREQGLGRRVVLDRDPLADDREQTVLEPSLVARHPGSLLEGQER